MTDRTAALQEAARGRSRGRLELLAWAISPDRQLAATLFRKKRDSDYYLESLYRWTDEGWEEQNTSNGGFVWESIGEDEVGRVIGALRYYGDAPTGAERAILRWRGETHEVPVQNGHFVFAIWDAPEDAVDPPYPETVGFLP